jgi:hypothetical protein
MSIISELFSLNKLTDNYEKMERVKLYKKLPLILNRDLNIEKIPLSNTKGVFTRLFESIFRKK